MLPEMWNCPYSNDSFPTYAGTLTQFFLTSATQQVTSRAAVLIQKLLTDACSNSSHLQQQHVPLIIHVRRTQLVALPFSSPCGQDIYSTHTDADPCLFLVVTVGLSPAEDIDSGSSPSTSMLSEAAKAHGVTLVGGSVPERSNGKLYNTCCVYDKTGKLLGKHR